MLFTDGIACHKKKHIPLVGVCWKKVKVFSQRSCCWWTILLLTDNTIWNFFTKEMVTNELIWGKLRLSANNTHCLETTMLLSDNKIWIGKSKAKSLLENSWNNLWTILLFVNKHIVYWLNVVDFSMVNDTPGPLTKKLLVDVDFIR